MAVCTLIPASPIGFLLCSHRHGWLWKTVGPFYVMTQSSLQPSATIQDFAHALKKAAKSFDSSKLQRAIEQA